MFSFCSASGPLISVNLNFFSSTYANPAAFPKGDILHLLRYTSVTEVRGRASVSNQAQRPLGRCLVGVNNILLCARVRLKIAFTPSVHPVVRNRKVPEDGRV